jgi:prepilin-type N-terminal cleavage/methylation domain-containing protein
MIRSSNKQHRFRGQRGFSLIEMVIVVGIAMVVSAMAVPAIRSSLQNYALRSSVGSLTNAIQSTRYQAIFQGCPYQLNFTAASNSYTVQSKVPAIGTSTCLAAYGPAGAAIPLAGSGASLGGNATLQFLPSGQVTATAGVVNPITFVITYPGLAPETITVSNYGRINVTP